MNIFKEMLEAKQETFNHESDLYVYVNSVTKQIVNNYQFKCNVTTFTSKVDGKLMYEIPFAYPKGGKHYSKG